MKGEEGDERGKMGEEKGDTEKEVKLKTENQKQAADRKRSLSPELALELENLLLARALRVGAPERPAAAGRGGVALLVGMCYLWC
jgi:hypothetical protein